MDSRTKYGLLACGEAESVFTPSVAVAKHKGAILPARFFGVPWDSTAEELATSLYDGVVEAAAWFDTLSRGIPQWERLPLID